MITDYLNQSATWKSVASRNEYNEPTFTSTTITCRFEYKRKMLRGPEGEQVMSEAVLYTASAVLPGDVVTYSGRDWPVLSVADEAQLDGTVLFRAVYM